MEKQNEIREYQQYSNLNNILAVNANPIHHDYWDLAITNNPNPKALYPIIIPSYGDLGTRLEADSVTQQNMMNGLKTINNKKISLNQQIEEYEAMWPKIKP